MWSSRIVPCVPRREVARPRRRARAAARSSRPQRRGPRCPRAGCAGARSPTKSSSTIASRVAVAPAPPPCCRAGRAARTRWSGVPRGLSSPSKRMNTIVWPRRGLIVRASWTTHGRARRAVVGAHEAGDVLGVVVGADHDVAGLAAAAPCRRRCAGRPAPARSARAGSSRRSRAASRATLASRPGAAPARPARAAAPRPRRESKRSTVGARDRAPARRRPRRRRTAGCRWPRARPGRGRAPPAAPRTVPSSFTEAIVAGRFPTWRSRDTRTA